MNTNKGKRRHEGPQCVSWKHGPRLWRAPLTAALVLACSALCGGVPVADASSADAQATHAYLLAQYRLVTALLHDARAVRGAEIAPAAQIARECPGVVSGMPQEHSRFPTPPPRARGENARLAQQEKTIGEELDTAVERPGDSLYRPAEEAWAAEVRRLSWSNPALTSDVRAGITAKLETIPTAAPPFCADARAWAQSGYRDLSAASREFEASQAGRTSSEQEEEGSLGTQLKPYETALDRALARRTNAVEYKLLAGAFAAIETISRLKRTLGYPGAATEEPKKEIKLGHGRTAAGTRFEISSGSGGPLGALDSCHRSASVFYSRPGTPEELIQGGPNNPICLSSARYRHPALFCEVGIETIQTAVPASVRSARLLLADGRTIESRVVRVPRGDGPAGIYAQEIRGSTSHAVSLVELDVHGGVVLTLELPRYHCRKTPNEPSTELPTSKELASGHTPQGEPFAIHTFGTLNGQPSLGVDLGIDPQLSEPLFDATKAFSWSLSIGCAPDFYAIFYAILRPPGESVTARTSQGVVPLNVVPLEPSRHAKGPLVYGVFSALPTELTVLGANGSIVYTESLQAKAAEATQFCEGYAEP